MAQNKQPKSFGRVLRGSILAVGASTLAIGLAATTAYAQDESESTSPGPANEPIVVTGSRLVTNGMQTPIPVTAVTSDELQASAPGPLITSISQLPQFLANETPNSGAFFTRGGYGNLNLRGLGINRTLTLLNGRRMPSSSAFGGVDINLFPEAMIQSVETVTGGASAAYGTDAVAGVVNFLINENYTGLELNGQYGVTDRGDNNNYEISGAFGTNIGDRGHIQVSGEYYKADGVHSYEGRDWYQAWGTLTNADGLTDFYPNVVSRNASFDGVIFAPGTAINGLAFDSSGNVAPFVNGSLPLGTLGTPPARHSIANGGSGEDLGSEAFSLFPDMERYSVYGYADYDISPDVTLFAQYIHGRTNTWGYNAPRGSFGGTPTALTIFQDNAYLPDDLRQTMIDNNIPSFTLRRTGSLEDIGLMALDDTTTQNIATAGFKWDVNSGGFMNGWNIDGNYQYGHSKRVWKQLGLRVDRIFAAVDAVDDGTGNIVCRTTLYSDAFAGCSPINLFGRGNASPSAIDYVVGNDVGEQITTPLYFVDTGFDLGLTDSYTAEASKVNLTTLKQHLAELTFAGNLVDNWAGPISLAFGGSYRKETLFQIVRDSTNRASDHDNFRPVSCNNPAIGLRGVNGPDCGNTVGIQYSKVWNIQADTEVWEAFAETLVPLANQDAFAANLHLAGRWADYSNSGTIWAYKAGLDVEVADIVRLRGTYSRDVRAPNITERYDKTGGTATIIDRRYPADGNVTVTRYAGGNPDLVPEKADTWTAGIVVQPTNGLSLSVDWYKVTIKQAIDQAGNQQVIDRCEIESLQEYCDLITRDPVTDRITLLGDLYQNIGAKVVSGVDAELAYNTALSVFGGDESLGTRVLASWLIDRIDRNSLGVETDYAGQTGYRQSDQLIYGYPDFKLTGNITYRNGGFSSFLQGRYIGTGIQDVGLTEGVNIVDNSVDSVFYVDLRLGYEFTLGNSTAELFGNVTNLFDTDPPITPTYSPFLGYAQQVNTGVYDVLGRRFTVGVKFKM